MCIDWRPRRTSGPARAPNARTGGKFPSTALWRCRQEIYCRSTHSLRCMPTAPVLRSMQVRYRPSWPTPSSRISMTWPTRQPRSIKCPCKRWSTARSLPVQSVCLPSSAANRTTVSSRACTRAAASRPSNSRIRSARRWRSRSEAQYKPPAPAADPTMPARYKLPEWSRVLSVVNARRNMQDRPARTATHRSRFGNSFAVQHNAARARAGLRTPVGTLTTTPCAAPCDRHTFARRFELRAKVASVRGGDPVRPR